MCIILGIQEIQDQKLLFKNDSRAVLQGKDKF